MAMMAKMRSLAPAFILTVGVLFVLFMVVSSSNVMDALGGRTNIIGKVNGEDITYQDFNKAVDQQRENQKNQTGKDVADQDMDKLRDQVWDAMVTEKLLEQYVNKFDITVSNQEVKDIILGKNPPEFLKRNFIDSTGKFNRQAYEAALIDPRNKDVMIQAEDAVRQQRLREKLQSELLASLTVSEPEIKREFIDKNIKIDVKYALVPLTQFPDSTVTVTDAELQDYYNKHIEEYKIVPKRSIKYVLFTNQPSAEDSQLVIKNLENVYKDLQNDTSSFKSYVDIYSSVPYSKDTLALNLIPEEAANLIYKSKPGQIIGPVGTSQGYAIYHVINILPSKINLIRVSHILIRNEGNDQKGLEEANKIYDQLQKGADFGKLAAQYSIDPGSKNKGGDLGWFGKGRMIPAFEKAAFGGKIGEILKPVKTNYGYHIIKVTGRSDNRYVIEKIVDPVTESAATKDARYQSASDFSYLAQKNDFEGEAKLEKLTVKESTPFIEDATTITEVGTNKRLVDFAFNNDIGAVSDVFKVQKGYVVAQVSQITKAGVLSFDDVKNRIKPVVIREKKFEEAKKVAEKIKSSINGDLDKATQIDPKAVVDTTGSFLAGATSIPKIYRDYAFLGEALKLDMTKISDPVKGIRGYYLMKILSRTKFDSSAYAAQRSIILNQLLTQKRNSFFQEWLSAIKKHADIVDNRYKFYNQ